MKSDYLFIVAAVPATAIMFFFVFKFFMNQFKDEMSDIKDKMEGWMREISEKLTQLTTTSEVNKTRISALERDRDRLSAKSGGRVGAP